MEEKDTKTITMPLSEYKRMEEVISKYNLKANQEIDEFKRDIKKSNERILKLQTILCRYEEKIEYLNSIYAEVLREKETLEKEIAELKQKKWWKFW